MLPTTLSIWLACSAAILPWPLASGFSSNDAEIELQEASSAEEEWIQLQGTILTRLATFEGREDPPSSKDFAEELARIDAFSKRYRDTEESSVAVAARLFQGSLLEDALGDYERAIDVYQILIEWPDLYAEFRGVAYARKGTLLARLDRLEELRKLVEEYKQREDADEAFSIRLDAILRHAELRPGAPFPAVELSLMDGSRLDPSKPSPTVLATAICFFHCKTPAQGTTNRSLDQLEIMQDIQKNTKNLRLLGISLDTNSSDVSKTMARRGLELPIAFDAKGWEGEAVFACGVDRLPTTYVLDAKGIITASDVFDTDFRKAILDALQAADG